MKVDPSGCIGIGTIFVVGLAAFVFVADTIIETAVLMNSEQYKAENVYKDGNVHIPNSALFNNPIAQLIYSNYLYDNVKNEDGSNFFNGDPYDIVGEWQAHNFAANLTGISLVLGLAPMSLLSNGDLVLSKIYEYHERSVHADIGPNINSEDNGLVKFVSVIFKWIFKISSLNILEW